MSNAVGFEDFEGGGVMLLSIFGLILKVTISLAAFVDIIIPCQHFDASRIVLAETDDSSRTKESKAIMWLRAQGCREFSSPCSSND